VTTTELPSTRNPLAETSGPTAAGRGSVDREPVARDGVRNDRRVGRLVSTSLRRVVDPGRSADLSGRLGDGQLVPDELLSVSGLGLALTAEERRTLAREEVASALTAGIRFEAVLTAGFGIELATRLDVTDPRADYALIEVGEESRHSRLFADLVRQIGPTARNALDRWSLRLLDRIGTAVIIQLPATFHALVLGGEEIPDLLQRLISEHPDTDPHLAAVNRYHRAEEARHLAFARLRLQEIWPTASPVDRRRHVGPARPARRVRDRRPARLGDMAGRAPLAGAHLPAPPGLSSGPGGADRRRGPRSGAAAAGLAAALRRGPVGGPVGATDPVPG
jgi:hypothetical protein